MAHFVGNGRVIFWDFDGTLAVLRGGWRGALAALLRAHDPATAITAQDLAPALQTGFPWHTPEVPHPELGEPGRWWAHMEAEFRRVYLSAGLDQRTAETLAARVRRHFLDAKGWELFDDVRPTLEALQAEGWRHVIISNHVPELPQLVESLGLGELIEQVITSAAVGYEKPHPEIYRHALEAAGRPGVAWMVGDNYVADVLGGEAAGMRAILVRSGHEGARQQCADLRGVIPTISST